MPRKINKKSLKTANLFKGLPDLVLRRIISEPNKSYTGQQLANELNISDTWANRILKTLEFEGFIKREGNQTHCATKISNLNGLMQRWKLSYNINFNVHHPYLCTVKDPLKYLALAAKKEGFQYAITGQAAKAISKNKPITDIPYVYIWPSKISSYEFNDLLTLLDDNYDFTPVKKKENIIILEPHQKGNVFFGSRDAGKYRVVADLQIILDL
jgi:DNA-binding Lrp family transcriptional regulator